MPSERELLFSLVKHHQLISLILYYYYYYYYYYYLRGDAGIKPGPAVRFAFPEI